MPEFTVDFAVALRKAGDSSAPFNGQTVEPGEVVTKLGKPSNGFIEIKSGKKQGFARSLFIIDVPPVAEITLDQTKFTKACIKAAGQFGANPGVLLAAAVVESRDKWRQGKIAIEQFSDSGAWPPFGFTQARWDQTIATFPKNVGSYERGDISKPQAQIHVTAYQLAEATRTLGPQLGGDVTMLDLFLAHHFGASGAEALQDPKQADTALDAALLPLMGKKKADVTAFINGWSDLTQAKGKVVTVKKFLANASAAVQTGLDKAGELLAGPNPSANPPVPVNHKATVPDGKESPKASRANKVDRANFYVRFRQLFQSTLTQPQVNGYEAIFDYWDQHPDLHDIRWLAYVLATTYHETGRRMEPLREGFCHTDECSIAAVTRMFNEHRIRQNYAKVDPATGQSYFGRGLVQLTFKRNYLKLGEALGKGDAFVKDPGLVLNLPVSVDIIFVGMVRGLFTGKKLSQFFNANREQWVNARTIINGHDRDQLIAGYGRNFDRCLTGRGF